MEISKFLFFRLTDVRQDQFPKLDLYLVTLDKQFSRFGDINSQIW